jgi:ubiquinone/menaquinone biosynthesis C-methylase UbiE
MSQSNSYVIRGGLEGRERLRVLARVMHASSTALFDRCGLRDGLHCLDAGCGGGDATLELARRVAPSGTVVGIDVDEDKIRIARDETRQQGIANADFRVADVRETPGPPAFDFVYARFLLTHLGDPAGAVGAFHERLRPGGVLCVEDIDFSGHFTHPESDAFLRYHELYCATVTRRGGDPNIGPRLPALMKRAGFHDITVTVVQPMAMEGEAKLISPLTLENIAGAVLEQGLASQAEIDELVRALYAFAADPHTLAGLPRIFQVWGRVR